MPLAFGIWFAENTDELYVVKDWTGVDWDH